MSHARLGTLLAGLFGLGWLIAIGVTLGVWGPFLLSQPPSFHDDPILYLAFVNDFAVSWAIFHIGASAGLAALLLLVVHLRSLRGDDPNQPTMTAAGAVGAGSVLLASLIDQFGTPVLARLTAGNAPFVHQVWAFVEPWRDTGLKTVAFLLLGIWLLWLAGGWTAAGLERWLARLSRFTGGALLLLALVEWFVPQPWGNRLGETGVLGVVFLLFPIWGFVVAQWYWQIELANWEGENE